MATLTNTKIKDTYDGLLKTTDNEALDVSGVTLIEDGLGNASALSVGRSGNGVSVSGLLDVSGEVQGTSLDINGAADISGNLAVDTNTLYVDAANNRVGIGGTPSEQLHLINGDDAVFKIESNGTDSTDDARIELTTTNGTFSIQNDRSIGTSGALTFAGNTSNNIVIDHNNGNVGIGTSSPNSYYSKDLVVQAGSEGGITIASSNTSNVNYFMFADGTSGASSYIGYIGYSHSDNSMSIATNGTEKFKIDSSGNVGINCSPNATLEIKGNLKIQRSSNTETSEITMESGNFDIKASPYGYPIAFHTGTGGSSAERMRIDSSGNVGIGHQNPAAFGKFVVQGTGNLVNIDATSGTASQGFFENGVGRFYLKTLSGSNGLGFYDGDGTSERMRIASSGSVLINTSDSTMQDDGGNVVTAGFKYQGSLGALSVRDTSNMVEFTRNGANYILTRGSSSSLSVIANQSGGVRLSAGATSWTSLSDETKKENISELIDALNKVLNYRCVEYNLIEDESKGKKIGFIAQDWQNDYPQVVDTNEDGVLSMKYTETIPVLLKAIQELSAKVSALESQLNA